MLHPLATSVPAPHAPHTRPGQPGPGRRASASEPTLTDAHDISRQLDLEIAPELGDLPDDTMRAALHQIADWVADYRATIERRTITPAVEPGDVARQLSASIPETGDPLTAILSDIDTVIMPGIVHWGHPAFLGYFGSTSNGPALLGEITAAALNVSAMTWKTSPAATELETVVLSWVRNMIGLDDRFFGVVYDTASVAVLHALAAARERICMGARQNGLAGRDDVPRLRVYASDQAHSSIEKAMIMLGLGESNVVRVQSDPEFRLDVNHLRAAIEADIARGYRPMAIVATIGTTSSASVDPVRAIAELCHEHRAWLHVDAAYGGAMSVLPEGRWIMDGTELADSLVINPHKWLFVPLDFSALYTRHPDLLRSVFALTPEYLRGDAADSQQRPANPTAAANATDYAIDYMDYSLQLGRRFRALKAWLVLRAFGRRGIEARIREHYRLAALLASWIAADPSFCLMAPVTMAVVCFRFECDMLSSAACDARNEAIVEAVNASGDAYVTHTRLHGRVAIRIGIGNILTTERHIAHVWRCIQHEAMTVQTRRSGESGNPCY
jgi:aromatic-L-amino-acid/L-tryptophan decarboxylase